MMQHEKAAIGMLVNYLRYQHLPVEWIAILLFLDAGVETKKELCCFFSEGDNWVRKRICAMRAGGLLRPFGGGWREPLELSDDGRDIVRRIKHGLSALVRSRVEDVPVEQPGQNRLDSLPRA